MFSELASWYLRTRGTKRLVEVPVEAVVVCKSAKKYCLTLEKTSLATGPSKRLLVLKELRKLFPEILERNLCLAVELAVKEVNEENYANPALHRGSRLPS